MCAWGRRRATQAARAGCVIAVSVVPPQTRYGSVNSSARGAEQQAPEAPDSVLLPHVPAPPSGAAPLGMCLVPVLDGAPLPRTGSTRTLTLSTSSLSV